MKIAGILSIVATTLLFSCRESRQDFAQADVSVDFAAYRAKFPVVSLPASFELNKMSFQNLAQYKKLDPNSEDTVFIKNFGKNDVYLYGMLEDTSRFYALLYLVPAEHYTPRLVTYTKDGKIISSQDLIAKGCTGECGVSRCVETASIQSDLSIFLADSSRYEFLCDAAGEELKGPGKIIVRYQRGQIGRDGSVQLRPQQQVELPKGPEPPRAPEPEGEW